MQMWRSGCARFRCSGYRSGSGGFRGTYSGQVPEGSGAEVRCGSREFRCRYLGEVPEGSGADAEVRLRKIPMQRL